MGTPYVSAVPGLRIISPAPYDPITLEEAKAHLRVRTSSEDALIAQYVAAATATAEEFTGRSFIETVWEQHMDYFPADGFPIELGRSPLLSIEGLFYQSGDTEEEVTDVEAEIGGTRGRIFSTTKRWPAAEASPGLVRARFRAGYVDITTSPSMGVVPADVKQAILLTLGSFYANRENEIVGTSVAALPINAEILLRRRMADLPLA